jgi:CSLREA domain-containing protein/uncharacterized repeat protein (TIGR01451 family)
MKPLLNNLPSLTSRRAARLVVVLLAGLVLATVIIAGLRGVSADTLRKFGITEPNRLGRLIERVAPRTRKAASAAASPKAVAFATITVTTLNDELNGATGNGGCSLREAIANANSDSGAQVDCAAGSGADTIALNVSGTYALTMNTEIAVTSNLTVQEGSGVTAVISGNSATRIFNVSTTSGNLTLSGLTLQNGSASTAGGCIQVGDSSGGALTFNNGTLQNCTTTNSGGAIGSSGGTHSITISNSTLQNNTAGINGGAISQTGTASNLSITNSTFSGNRAGAGPSQNAQGGAILWSGQAAAGGTISITGSGFNNNLAQSTSTLARGGAILATFSDSGATGTISNSTFTNNQALSGSTENRGGAIYKTGVGSLTISNSSLNGNSASSDGGALFQNQGNLAILSTTISGNSSGNGGGIANVSGGLLTLINSTVSGNTATGNGGGIQDTEVSNPTRLRNCTITNNTAGTGGGMAATVSQGLADIGNSIIAGNTATTAPDYSGDLNSQGYNLFSNSSGIGSSLAGTDIVNASPGLAALANNGGTTLTHGLQSNSPAINAGSNALAVDTTNGNAALTTDQRGTGFPRTNGGTVDIGAFEALANIVTNSNDSGAGSLRQVIADAAAGSAITFQTGVTTVTLTSAELAINKNLTIDGGAAGVTLTRSGATQFRIFNISSGTVELKKLTISNGNHPSQAGGIQNSGTLTMTECAVTGNTAPQGAGLQNDGSLTMTNCTISGNTTTGSGGGLAMFGTTTTLTNCTVSGNTASGGSGGGFSISSGTLNLTNCTVANNTALDGGALSLSGSTHVLKNTIVANNTATSTSNENISGTVSSTSSFNLIGVGGAGGLTDGVNANQVGVANPLLDVLANNGGYTQTIALLLGSPALDKGAAVSGMTTDQRGQTRPYDISTIAAAAGGNHSDIGAFEVNPTCNTVAVNPSSLPSGTVGLSYTQTITASGGDSAYTFTVTSGSLPTGLILQSDGTLTGLPTAAGTFNFTVTAAYGFGCTGSRAFSLSIASCGASTTYTVNDLGDAPDASAGNGVCATAGGVCTLRAAIQEINALPSCSNTINFSVTGTINLSSALPDLSGYVLINGPGANQLTIRRNSGGSYRLFNIPFGAAISFSGLTLSNGLGDEGGAMRNAGSLTVTDCALTGNQSKGTNAGGTAGKTGGGAAIFNDTTGVATVTRSLINNNTATGGNGEFANGGGGGGGGLGGGIFNNGGTLTVTNSTLTGNQAIGGNGGNANSLCPSGPGGKGGGKGGEGGSAGGFGGGGSGGGNPGGYAPGAGGRFGGAGGSRSISCSTSGAGTGGSAGGGALFNYGGTSTLVNVTIVSNTVTAGNNGAAASRGGGIYNETGTVTVKNSIVAGNTAQTAGTEDCDNNSAPLTTSGYNLFGSGTGCPTGGTQDQTIASANLFTTVLGPLGYYGGTTQTFRPLVGSPVIDKGSAHTGITVDQRNKTRPVDQSGIASAPGGNASDLGAFEAQSCPAVTIAPSSLANIDVGSAYSQTFTGGSGTAPYTFTVTAGTLPTGLSLTLAGVLSGTPTATGAYNFTITMSDDNGCLATQAYTVNVVCPTITIDPTSLPNSVQGANYSQTFTATGGTGTITWSSTGTLPGGLSLSSSTGVLSGTPNANGSFTFTITATRQYGCTGSRQYTVVINPCVSSFTVNDLGDGADFAPGNGVCETASGNGLCTLRAAIQEANALPGCAPHTITVGSGTINLDSVLPDLNANMAITGPGANQLTVQRNPAAGTPAFRVFNIASGRTVTLRGMTISNGRDSIGAGVRNNSGTLTIIGCAITGNTAAGSSLGRGGGIYTTGGALTVVNSTVSGNQSIGETADTTAADAQGGGIQRTTTALTLINTTISGNSVQSISPGGTAGTTRGGGLYLSSSGTLTAINVTITNNSATGGDTANEGGGVYSSATGNTQFNNTIIAGNTAATSPDILATVVNTSVNNLIGDGTGLTGLTNGGSGNLIGTSGGPINPRLSALASNGGSTQTHALLAGSPALDGGNNASLPADTLDLDGDSDVAEPLPLDQRGAGFKRLLDAADADTTQQADIGAFEANPVIQDIANQTTNEDTPLTCLSFNIGDAGEGFAGFTVSSDNQTLVPDANLSVTGGGTSSEQCLNITPAANQSGTATITITLNGSNGLSMTDTFVLTVNADNDLPTITAGGPLTRQQGAAASNSTLATVNDVESGPGGVAVTVISANPSNGVTLSNIVNTNGTITADIVADCAATNASFTLQVSDGSLTATANLSVNVTVATPPTAAAAGPDQTLCATAPANLAANAPSAGTGAWSVVSGPSTATAQFNSLTNPAATFTPAGGAGTYTLRWTITGACATSTDDVVLTYNAPPTTASAGPDQTFCSTSPAMLAANAPTIGTGAWTVVSGPSTSAAQFSSTSSPTATFTPAGGTGVYTLRWTISNAPCTVSTDDVVLTYNAAPTITLGASPSVFPGTTSANLMYSATTGSPNQYSIDYDSTANTAGFADVNNATLPGSIGLTVPGAAAPGVYNGTLTVRNSTTGCVSAAVPFTVMISSCPTSFTVNDLGDAVDASAGNGVCETATGNGVCTLRAALQEANALTSCSPLTINITVNGTITLTSALPALAHPNLSINGPGASLLTISGANTFRVFNIASGDVTLDGLTVANGQVTGSNAQGGGIFNASSGTVTIRNCAIANNTALATTGGASGGGIHHQGGTLNVLSSIISGNTASGTGVSATSTGGGMFINAQSTGAVNVTNCTIVNNSCSANGTSSNLASGGGFYNSHLLNLMNCTISGNSVTGTHASTRGGGITANAGTVTMGNTIVANNTSSNTTSFGGPDIASGVTSTGYNLIKNTTSAFISGTTTGNQLGVDPLLAALGNYGGPTQTFALLPGSPAINAGTSTDAPLHDQRGKARAGNVDIGAFESQGFTLALSGGSPQTTAASTAFANPLAVTVTANNSTDNEPVNGGQVTFTPPGSGASATLAGNPATIANGAASVSATANATVGGPYNVVADASGAAAPVNFVLTNAAVAVAINVPAGVSFTLNAVSYTGSQNLNLAPGSYTLATTSPQSLGAGTRAVFQSWSDGGDLTHTITVTGSPLMITGNFTTQYQLTTAAGTGGSVSPASGAFYDANSVVNVTATPNTGYNFVNWTGPVANANTAATTVTLDAPKSITANFTNPAPTVLSINRAGASPTNAASVGFSVLFSESLTGVSASNFTLVPGGGISGASLANVMGSGTTWTVTVNTGAGSGTLGLNMTNSSGVTDAGGAALSNLPFTGQVYTLDKDAPATMITGQPANLTNSTGATFSFTATDMGGGSVASFECKLDSGNFAVCTSSKSYTGLTEGSHTFQVRAIDSLGNVEDSPASFSWTVDTTAPDTLITGQPSNPSSSASATFSFNGSDSHGVASFECKLDSGAFTACTSPQSYTGLSEGPHTFQVRAIDNAGNVDGTPASYTWTVDAAQPNLTLSKSDGGATVTPGGTVAYTLTYSNSGEGATGVVLTETVPAQTTFNAGASTAGWVCLPNNTAGSTCTLSIGSVSNGGNGSATFAVTVANPVAAGVTQISNTASIADDGTHGTDPQPSNNIANDTTTLNAAPDLSLDKTDAGATVLPGGTVVYTLSYANTGNQAATGVVLTETVSAHTTFNAGASTAGWQCTPNGQAGSTCTLNVGNLNGGGAQGSATFAVAVAASGLSGVAQISNTASMADDGANGADPTPNNTDTETTPRLCQPITVGPANLATGQVNVPYTQSFTQAGGLGTMVFSTASTLPDGLLLAPNGVLSGTPMQSGAFPLVITATDVNGCTGTARYTLQISACPALTLTPANLAFTLGASVNQALTPSAGAAPFSFTLQSGNLPPNLVLSGSGVLSGTATQIGTFNFAVRVQDHNGCSGTQSYTVAVTCPAITLGALPAATIGAAYAQTIGVTPAGTYTFAVTQGQLPPGLLLDEATGLLSGTPTSTGTFQFRLAATGFGGACTGSQNYSLTVNCPSIALTPASLPNGQQGVSYSQTVAATPSGPTYSYTVTQGGLPPGLVLNAQTGVVSGTPSANGAYTFVVQALSYGVCTGTRTYTLQIAPCGEVSLSPATLPGGTVGTAFTSTTFTATPAGTSYSFAVTGGALPPGLSLAAATGVLSGTPTASGTFSFSITATGAAGGCTGSRSYTLSIACPAITLAPATLPPVTAGVSYNQTLSASPTGTYSFSLLTGNLPPGLSLDAQTGVLSGLATTTGSYSFSVRALGAGGCSGTQSYTLAVVCPTITVTPANLPGATVGTAYSQSLSATPSGNYTFTRTSGSLPGGLTLSAAGVLSGTPTATGTFTFTITATGFGTCTRAQQYTLTVAAACTTITLPSLPATGKLGVSYYGNLAATTPSGSYTFTRDSGTLPPGLVLDNLFTALTGKPTALGTYAFTLKATRSNGCTGTRAYSITISSAQAALAQVADYDGDGQADPALWTQTSGRWSILHSGQRSLEQTAVWGTAGDQTLLGDYDGDGRTDVAVFRPANGTWYIQRSSDGTALVKAWGAAGDVPVPGDYDGDGQTDLAIWRPSEGHWYLWRSHTQDYAVVAWGAGVAPYLDVPVPGDYDGDGKTDLAVFRRQTGTWLIKRSSDGQVLIKAWGVGTDVPVAGDYDGDGRTDVAIWRGATGEWFVWRSAEQRYQITAWGAAWAGDVAAPGDYDGDGRTDLAVWRAGEGRWYVRLSGDATAQTPAQGQLGDRPVVARP